MLYIFSGICDTIARGKIGKWKNRVMNCSFLLTGAFIQEGLTLFIIDQWSGHLNLKFQIKQI
jgi:hypothetical protein